MMRTATRRRWGIAVLAVAVFGVMLVAGGSAALVETGSATGRAVMCLGLAATIEGTGAGETIDGTVGDDVIVGLGGNDTINGLGGRDRLCGGLGTDTTGGGAGNARVDGGGGNDTIVGGLGADILKGGAGADYIKGSTGNDRLLGEAGNDTLNGGLGTDTCYGETKASCELPAPTRLVTFGNGTWVVGRDIPAGRYRMISDGTSCYWARLSGFGGTPGDRIIGDYVNNETLIVDIKATDKGFSSSGCNTWSNDLSSRRRNPSARLASDGHLLVGTEIAAGTWRTGAVGAHCLWMRLSGFSGEDHDIVAEDSTYSFSVVTIAPTDVGFYADADCGTWTKTG